jgi:tricorn protease
MLAAALTAGASIAARADVSPDARMLRYPGVSSDQIAFVYATGVWVAPKSGGPARPVANPPGGGESAFPRFSPDGKTLAFVANFDGNRDIYTVRIDGGVPLRVTHHPTNETLCGWKDESTLLFFAPGMAERPRTQQLYTVSASGGLPTKLPVPYAAFGAISADGSTLAYTPHSTDARTWKRYRGGMATDIWLFNLNDNTSKKITDWEGTDSLAMWGFGPAAKTVYYVSDAGKEHRLNIWSYDTTTNERAQITTFADNDVRWPSIGPSASKDGKGDIVFQLGSELMLLDLNTGRASPINITIPGARPIIRERIEDASRNIQGAVPSPSGKRALITARGDLWSVPAKEGVTRNLTSTPGAFEREGAWSPDGRWIAYLSDQSGEYEIWLRASDASASEAKKDDDKKDEDAKDTDKKSDDKATDDKKSDEHKSDDKKTAFPVLKQPVKLTNFGPGFRSGIVWAPDSKHLVTTDNAGNIHLVSISFDANATPGAGARTTLIDTDPWAEMSPSEITWTHDSSYIAYEKNDEGTNNSAIWLCKIPTDAARSEQPVRLTNPMFKASRPRFDRTGSYLFYTSARNYTNPRYADNDSSFIYTGTEQWMMAPLRADVKNPLGPKSDEEEIKKDDKPTPARRDADKKDEKKADDDKKDGEKRDADKKADDKSDKSAEKSDKSEKSDKPESRTKKPKPITIDTEGFEQRSILLPIPAGNFGSAGVTDEGKLLYVRRGSRGEDERSSIKLFDPKSDKKEEETVTEAPSFTVASNGKKLLINRQAKWSFIDPVAGGGKAQDISTAGLRVVFSPKEEWKQIFTDAWRLERDLFYVDNMHGVDWAKMREHYGKMLEDAASREDVQYIIAELISELNVGHAYVGAPGDVQSGPSLNVGLLGCDFSLEGKPGEKNSVYKIERVVTGAPWDADARSPLERAVNVSDGKPAPILSGTYLLAVNGSPLDTRKDPWTEFIGLADRVVTLTVSDKADGSNPRDVLVKTISSESTLRFRNWVERNRAYVDRNSDGKIGYIYVPDTGQAGQNELFRQFFGQRDKAALVIDERWNGGGQIPNRFIELLNRPRTNSWARRHGRDWTWPPDAHEGPIAMLANGLSGSGGDMFPWLFKHHKLGKLIGTRTWGGLVGITGTPGLIDGGGITVPTFGFYKNDGTWGIEGHGVDPDITIIDDPGKMHDHLPQPADPQLDEAIKVLLEEVKTNPGVRSTRPAAPDRSGMGIPEKDR